MSEIQAIPLSQLRASPRNVRKLSAADVADLAASIASHGLLQNLAVSPAGDGFYEVEAGGRRLRALQSLADAGSIAAEYPVPCRVLDVADNTIEASLAENFVREQMHPADEFDAFKALADSGLTVAEIANRFGVTELLVTKRLKLANVAPELLDLYRTDEISLEQVMALALTDDHAVQRRVWKQAKHDHMRSPWNLRRAITEQELSLDSSIGRFVGAKAYEKAGGIIRRDLFADDHDDKGYLTDAGLAMNLAQEKLQAAADRVAKEGWAWVETHIEFSYSDESRYGRAPVRYEGGKDTWADEVKASSGAVVTIGYNGQTEVKRGLVRPEDRKAATKAAKSSGSTGEVTGGRALKEPGQLSFAGIRRLQAEGTAIVRAQVAESPRTALALLVAQLGTALYNDRLERRWVFIGREHSGRVSGPANEVLQSTSPGAQRLAEIEEKWRKVLPKTPGQLLAWALERPYNDLAALLAFLVAREIEAVDIHASQRNGVTALAKAAHVDLAEHWKPSEDWLATLSKAVIVEMVRDAAGKTAAAEIEKLKKAQLPAAALAKLPAGWLPKPLRAPRATKAPKAKKAAGKDAAAGAELEEGEEA